ncbi:MAG: VWA domain-containing protein, partial [Burkholderiales bacterium]
MSAPMRRLAWAFALFLAVFAGGCGDKAPETKVQPATATTLTVLAGSELRDIEPLLPMIQAATGVTLQLKYSGTLEAVERLQAGEPFDTAWLSSNRYALLTPGARERIRASERTMITPVVLGLKASKAKELGWLDNPNVTW